MSEIFTILNKVFVKEYYRLNAGFFLVIGTLTFGFMSGREHLALAQFFISSPFVMLIPIAIWTIYTLKIINFNRQQLQRPENQFLFTFGLLPTKIKSIGLYSALSLQLMPALLYGFFLILLSIKFKIFESIALVAVSLSALLIVSTAQLLFSLHRPHHEKKTNPIKKFFDYQYAKTIIQFYTGWLLRREPVLFFGTKVFSGLLIFAVAQLYLADAYDGRLMAMGVAIGFSANYMVLQQLHRFENQYFIIIRNLPLSFFKRLFIFLITFTALCLPEIALLTNYFPSELAFDLMFWILLFGLSIGIVFYGSLFLPRLNGENSTYVTFGAVMGLIVLILFDVPIWSLIIANFSTGLALMKRYYYSFEFNA